MNTANSLRCLFMLLLSASCLCEADTALEILERARRGDRIAMRQIGRRLIQGDGVPRKVSSGIGWLEKAAGEGDDVAMLMLGDIYRNGIGVTKNMRKAIRYYEDADRAGSEVAVERLAKYRPESDKKRSARREREVRSSERSVKRSHSPISGNKQNRSQNNRNSADEAAAPEFADAAGAGKETREHEKGGDGVSTRQSENRDKNYGRGQGEEERLPSAQRVARQKLEAQGIPENEYSRRAVEAAEKGELELLKLLFDAGLDSKDSTDLLLAAAKGGQTKIIEYLISKGAQVHATGDSGQTALHAAALHGRLEVVEQLLKAGASVDVPDNQGYTPLHAAVRGGSAGIANRLITAGGSVEAISREGKTPLHLAAESGSVELTLLLISSGANVNHVNSQQQKTALETAADNKHWDIYKILRQAGAKN